MKKKILLIEDDKFLIRIYGKKLETSGYEIFRLESGVDALTAAKEKKPDLILLDLVMPNKNGFDVLKELTADSETKNIPVIVVSNLGGQNDIDEAMKLGAKKFVIKSNVGFQELKDIVAGQLASQE